MSRARVVLNLLAARQAARQTGEHTWAPSQPSSRIRNRPAMHTSSIATSTGKSQPVKVQSRPFHPQRLPHAAPAIQTSEARSILNRLQARRERLATTRSTSHQASIPAKHETWTTVRQRHATRPRTGASSEKQAPRQPLIAHRARQVPPVVENLDKPPRQPSSASSVMTGSSFSFIVPTMVAQAISTPRPLTPQAPRAVRHHDVNSQPVPFAIPSKSSKVPLRGILKRNGQHRSTARRAITWARELTEVKVVDRWIGEPDALDSPEVVVDKSDHVYPDPAKFLSRIRSWPGPHGRDHYVFGNTRQSAEHAECQSPECNKRLLHQHEARKIVEKWTQHRHDEMVPGESIFEFNARRDFRFSRFQWTEEELPKDLGLEWSKLGP